jgi:DNA primase
MNDALPSLGERKLAVKRRVPIGAYVAKHVKLSGSDASKSRRGRCPFHSGNSPSFAVSSGARPEEGFGHCFGCQWHGDVIKFAMNQLGLAFMDALAELEREAGILSGGTARAGAGPIHRERNPSKARSREWVPVDTLDMGRWIWKHARPNLRAVRCYFMGRGVPEAILLAERFSQFRYLAECPAVLWEAGSDPRKAIHNPAIVAMVRRPVEFDSGRVELVPVGVHVTYLDPDGSSTMKRRKPWAKPDDPDPWLPKRRMLGPVKGGAVFLGEYRPDARLWIGEGNETVFSGMALGQAGAADVGVAALSLDNLQGPVRLRQGKFGRIWPLYEIAPDVDAEWAAFGIPGHCGAVTGLIDSDMSPLAGVGSQGENVIERKGGPIVRRPITGAERATICGELFVRTWRARGVQADAVRAPAGMDFNDVTRSAT